MICLSVWAVSLDKEYGVRRKIGDNTSYFELLVAQGLNQFVKYYSFRSSCRQIEECHSLPQCCMVGRAATSWIFLATLTSYPTHLTTSNPIF